MIRSQTPPLNMLRAFEASARHESFSRAAEELHVTPGAISQQVKALEDILGLPLFRREKQRLYLTEPGQNYWRPLKASLDRIEEATRSLLHLQNQMQEVKIGILPSLFTHWLLPKLGHFQELHPSIQLSFTSISLDFKGHLRHPEWEEHSLDMALFFGDGHWDGLTAEKLMGEELVPVAAPSLMDTYKIRECEDILSLPLLYHSTRPQSWNEWALMNGLPAIERYGYRLEHFHMLMDAACRGLGAAMIPTHFLDEHLSNGDLIILPGKSLIAHRGYFLLTPAGASLDEASRIFKHWLLNTLSQSKHTP